MIGLLLSADICEDIDYQHQPCDYKILGKYHIQFIGASSFRLFEHSLQSLKPGLAHLLSTFLLFFGLPPLFLVVFVLLVVSEIDHAESI